MSGLTGNNILAGSSGQGEYKIEQSLRFDNSSYLSQTQTQNNNRQKFIFSFWFKPTIDEQQWFFASYKDSNNFSGIYLDGTENFRFESTSAGILNIRLKSSRVFRDYGNWYHAFVRCDTTATTPGANDIAIWINGEKITDFQNEDYPSQNYNTEINENGATHYIGQKGDTVNNRYYRGYLAEFHFIPGDTGLSKSFSDFGETDVATGKWIPKKYTGGYSAAGFYLPFADSSDLGKDYSSSSQDRNYTSNGVTANDQVLDSPTNNFAMLNYLGISDYNKWTFTEGNLKAYSASNGFGEANFYLNSGKWYFEVDHTNNGGKNGFIVALVGNDDNYVSGSFDVRILNSVAVGLYGVSIDMDTGGWSTTLNGSALSSGSFTSQECKIAFVNGNTANSKDFVVNFGQDSSFAGARTAQNNTDSNGRGDFYYAPTSGYLALCEDNLLNPSIILPGEHFNTVLYSGDGSASNSITGVGFQPDLSWIKTRNDTQWHILNDVVRGVNKSINSNAANAEFTDTDRFLSFDVDGFTVGADGSVNGSGDTLVSWNWKADNTSGSTNTDGTITSTVSANPTAGFSIVKYTGNATAGATVGHGLSQAPEFVIVKQLDAVKNWSIYANDPTDYLTFTANASADDDRFWNDTSPGASVFTLGGINWVNASGNDYIAYCFHSVEGYSKVGSYTGNGSADGPFVYTGFRPAFVIIKSVGEVADWYAYDSARSEYNVIDLALKPSTSGADIAFDSLDFVSNGFKWKISGTGRNNSSQTYIYIAFAESPFKYSNAR